MDYTAFALAVATIGLAVLLLVLCLGARLIEPDEAVKILEAFLSAAPSMEPRHVRRVQKIRELGECTGAPST